MKRQRIGFESRWKKFPKTIRNDREYSIDERLPADNFSQSQKARARYGDNIQPDDFPTWNEYAKYRMSWSRQHVPSLSYLASAALNRKEEMEGQAGGCRGWGCYDVARGMYDVPPNATFNPLRNMYDVPPERPETEEQRERRDYLNRLERFHSVDPGAMTLEQIGMTPTSQFEYVD